MIRRTPHRIATLQYLPIMRFPLHFRLRALVGAALALGLLCTVPNGALRAQGASPVIRMPAYPQLITLDTLVLAWEPVAGARDQVLLAVRATYQELKLEPDFVDPAGGSIGTLKARARLRLGGEKLSNYFNCGRGMTGENADEWRLTIAAVTFSRKNASGALELGTGVTAQAQDMGGASTQPAPCGSMGTLEARILAMVRARLAAAPAR